MLTRHTQPQRGAHARRQELTFNQCANDLFAMIASGDFPDLGAPTGPRRGAPAHPTVWSASTSTASSTFASPNALSAFNRMGFDGELEGESLAEVTTELLHGQAPVRRVAAAWWSPAARRGAPTSRRAGSP